MTIGKPGRRFWIPSITSKCSPNFLPGSALNLYAPWLVPIATASESHRGLFDEFLRFVRVGQANAADDVFLDAAELAQFRFDGDVLARGPRRRPAW